MSIIRFWRNKKMINIIKDTITKRNKKFERVLFKTQPELKEYLSSYLSKDREVVNGDGYLYSPGSVPVMLVAHMDTVHKETPKEIIYANGTLSSPQGIGGDDRCGVYMILQIIKEINCHILFVEDEEVGCVGSTKFTNTELAKSLKGKFHFIIELDRKGSTDAVFYECENDEFTAFVTTEFFKLAYGSYTDICEIGPALKTACVNLSCGYYKQHTTDEYIVLSEMETVIEETKKLINRGLSEGKTYEYVESFVSRYSRYDDYWAGYNYYGYAGKGSKKDDWWDGYAERFFIIFYDEGKATFDQTEMVAATYEEALGKFFMEYQNVCGKYIVGVYDEDDNPMYENEILCDMFYGEQDEEDEEKAEAI